MKTSADIVQEARKYLGVRFVHQGRTKFGLDCAGLIILIGKNLGLRSPASPHQIFDISNYGRQPEGRLLEHMCDKHLLRQPDLEEMIRGCVLLFRIGKEPQHLGIVSRDEDRKYMVHSYQGARGAKKPLGFCCEHIISEEWEKRLIAVYRYPGVVY